MTVSVSSSSTADALSTRNENFVFSDTLNKKTNQKDTYYNNEFIPISAEQQTEESPQREPPETLASILEIDGNGVLSQFEINTWREIAQGDIEKLNAGKPTPEQQETIAKFKEFLVLLDKHFPEVDGETVLLENFDADGNGALSGEEIAQAKTELQQQINGWVNTGADKTLYVHAQQLVAALTALAPSEEEVQVENIAEIDGSFSDIYPTDSTAEIPLSPLGSSEPADYSDSLDVTEQPVHEMAENIDFAPDEYNPPEPTIKNYNLPKHEFEQAEPVRPALPQASGFRTGPVHYDTVENSKQQSKTGNDLAALASILEIDGDNELSNFEIDTWKEVTQGDIEQLENSYSTPENDHTIERFKQFLVYLENHSSTITNEEVILREFDYNGSGSLSAGELNFAKAALQSSINDWISTDADKTLYVHAEQLLKALNGMEPTESAKDSIINNHDTDGDDCLSLPEIQAAKEALKEHILGFVMADVDGIPGLSEQESYSSDTVYSLFGAEKMSESQYKAHLEEKKQDLLLLNTLVPDSISGKTISVHPLSPKI